MGFETWEAWLWLSWSVGLDKGKGIWGVGGRKIFGRGEKSRDCGLLHAGAGAHDCLPELMLIVGVNSHVRERGAPFVANTIQTLGIVNQYYLTP
jgi:hypothetical protein